MNRKFNFMHVLPIRRSADGRVLGVFKGIAEHAQFSCRWTRILGVLSLLAVGGTLEKVGLGMPAGPIMLYVLVAMLMQPPLGVAEGFNGLAVGHGASRVQPVFPTPGADASRPLDLAALEQRLESLGRRVAKMENVVVTRERDWDRRLGS